MADIGSVPPALGEPPAATPPSAPSSFVALPAVSPTGTAVLSQMATRVALGVFGISGAIAAASAAGIDISFLPPIVPKICALVAFVAAFMGMSGPGVRK